MTKIVKRGAGRPAHTARTNRHAQRNPLPPKQRDIEDAKAALVESNKILSNGKGKAAEGQESPVETKSWRKAAAFLKSIAALGWEAKISFVPDGETDDIVEVLAQRGDEHIWISWTKGAMTLEPMPTYTINDRTIKLKNASACLRYASRSAEQAECELDKVVSNKYFRRKPTKPKPIKYPDIPFDVKLATNEEIIAALLGRTVSWHNRYREVTETATLGRDDARVQIIEQPDGERTVKFCCTKGGGFRAFHVSALTKVGE